VLTHLAELDQIVPALLGLLWLIALASNPIAPCGPDVVDAFFDALFAAHFALGEDLGDRATVDRHAAGAGIDPDALDRAFADGSALRDLHRVEAPGAE